MDLSNSISGFFSLKYLLAINKRSCLNMGNHILGYYLDLSRRNINENFSIIQIRLPWSFQCNRFVENNFSFWLYFLLFYRQQWSINENFFLCYVIFLAESFTVLEYFCIIQILVQTNFILFRRNAPIPVDTLHNDGWFHFC